MEDATAVISESMFQTIWWKLPFLQYPRTGVKISNDGMYEGSCYLVINSCLTFANPWTVAHQAPLSMGFFRQEYWSGFPCLPPGDLPNPGTEPMSLTSPALAGKFFTTSTTWEGLFAHYFIHNMCPHAVDHLLSRGRSRHVLAESRITWK